MRPRPWPHVLVLLWTGVAAAQGHVVPDYATGPAKLAVTPFENHVTNGKSLEWIVAEAPFEIAEKAETVLGLEATGAPLYVPGERVPAEADTVADFAKKQGAQLVVTGWFDRIGEQLRIAVLVWKADKGTAKTVGNAQRMGPVTSYHKLLGEAMGEAWSEAGVPVDIGRSERLSRPLSNDIYPVFMMGRGLGHFTGALAAMSSVFGTGTAGTGPDLKSAEHDLERAVFLDPKLFEAQRLLGELYMVTAKGDAKLVAKATGKFNYAADLAPDDAPSLRAAAFALARAGKWEPALDLFARLVQARPWDLEARFQLGAALWQTGDGQAAERQLEQVTAHVPDHLAARRVLVLIHASRSDTPRLIGELEAIAVRAPHDLDIKSDLATAYGSLGQWKKAIDQLELVARDHGRDMPLLVRVGDAYVRNHQVEQALPWYQRAARVDPDSSLPGFAAAQALFDAGRFADATRAYQNLQKGGEQAAAEHALGVIAIAQNRPDDAAWYLRKATREAPRSLVSRRAVIAAELMRKDAVAAQAQLDHALPAWPHDAVLQHLAELAHRLAGGEAITVDFKPDLVRPWGDGEALQAALDQYLLTANAMASVRYEYQAHVVALLGMVGKGPKARPGPVKVCPVALAAPSWFEAQKLIARYTRLGSELEDTYRFLARHDELGMSQALMPTSRLQLANAKKSYKQALADVGELRAEWQRGVTSELRAVGCSDKLLAAAIKDPMHYRVVQEDKAEPLPARPPPRPKPRSTFFVDNTRCPDGVDVWIDGAHVGQVAPGRRSALVADGGERTLCLLVPGSAQCGDRGTVRQVYLHDGWSTTVYCPK